ncbi:MAG: hypothetical protein ACODAU_09895 [Myxococcota bacterium]
MKGVSFTVVLAVALELAGCGSATGKHARPRSGSSEAPERDPLRSYAPRPLPEIEHAEGLELVWDKVEPGWVTGNSTVGDTTALSDGGFVVSGRHSGKLTLGHDDGNPTDLGEKKSRTRRNFLARYDATGKLIWARNIGGSSIRAITSLPDGALIISGHIARPTMLGSGNDPDVSTRFGVGTPKETRVSGCDPVVQEHQRLLPDEKYMPRGYTHRPDHSYAPSCTIGFVARYDLDGNLQWLRTIHSQFQSTTPVYSVMSDGSVVVTVQLKGVALLDAGTSAQQRVEVPFPPKRHVLGTTPFSEVRTTPFLIRYTPEGSVSWIRQLGEDFEPMKVVGVSALSDGTIAIAALKGTYWSNADDFAPRLFVGRLDGRGAWLWQEDALVIDVPSNRGVARAHLAKLPDDDLLVTYHLSGAEGPVAVRSTENRVVHQETFDSENRRENQGSFAARFDGLGRPRWYRQLTRGTMTFGPTVLADGSWLASGSVCKEAVGVVGPHHAARTEWKSSEGDCRPYIARFGPDGKLDAVFDPHETSENIAGRTFTELSDGTLLSAGTKSIPGSLASRVVLGAFRLSFDSTQSRDDRSGLGIAPRSDLHARGMRVGGTSPPRFGRFPIPHPPL